MTTPEADDIAVVGIGCRFPGADNLDEYWRVLENGENHIKEIPTDRWSVNDFYDEDPSVPGKAYVKKAALVKDYNEWDHKLYGINELEAEFVDPQQRMVLDCVHMALEDAGIRRKDIDGSQTAVYIGSMNADYQNSVITDHKAVKNYTAVGVHNSIISARVAFVYNLFGTAITLDTACSSSLVAIHLGGQALKLGECDTVICGGVNSITDPTMFVFLSKANMLSPTGQSRPFSAAANGYARGEGCGMVILKRLKDAIRDGNKIWGVLKTGSNQDGHTATPITAPSGRQQMDLLDNLYTKYGVDSREVQVIEAHGTGTPVGDPIETNALGQFFSRNRDKKAPEVFIGTVKSNIGHTEAAAGTAGLIKILLMMHKGKVVPSLLDKSNINPKIDFKKYGFEVPDDVKQWQRPKSGARIACVNSFGFGGTNAHAIVTEHIQWPQDRKVKHERSLKFPYIVSVSAQDEESLVEQVDVLSKELKNQEIDMGSLSYTSLCKRDLRSYRKAFAATSQAQLIEQCDLFVKAPTAQHRVDKTKLAFVFCGVGTTWEGMCKFMMTVDAFRTTIETIDKLLKPLAGWTLTDKLSNSGNDVLADPLLGHVSIFGCQVGLAKVWEAFGITPDVVIGQSVGEVAAAYISGGIDLESAVRVIYYRSKYLSEVTGGCMAVVKNVDTQLIEDICKTTNGKLTIAVYNSPTSCTISGDKSTIDLVRSKMTNGLGAAGGVLIDLDVKCAYHSPYVEEAAEKATQHLKGLKGQKVTVPIISTVTGQEEKPEFFSNDTYWKRNTRQSVLFNDAIRASAKSDGKVVFLEIGPSPVLGAHIKNIFKNETVPRVLPSMRRKNESSTLSSTLCSLLEMGYDLSSEMLAPVTDQIQVPKYAFRAIQIPFKAPRLSANTHALPVQRSTHLYVKAAIPQLPEQSFTIDIDRLSTPFIYDHIVKGNVLVPGAFYADLGFCIGESVLHLRPREATVSLEFTKTAKVEDDLKSKLSVSWYGKTKQHVFFIVKQNDHVVVHGRVARAVENNKVDTVLDLEQIRLSVMQKSHKNVGSDDLYRELDQMGFSYGKCFRIMERCISGDTGGVVDFRIPEEVFKDINSTNIHPCLLDGMLQSTLLAIDKESKKLIAQENLILLPVAIEEIHFYSKPESRHIIAYTVRTNTSILENAVKVHFNSLLLNADGSVIAEIRNFTTFSRRGSSFIPDEVKYQPTWTELEAPFADHPMPKTLVVDISSDPTTEESFLLGNVITCSPKEYHLTADTFGRFLESSVKSKWGAFDKLEAVVVIFGANDQMTINSNTTQAVYQSSKQRCMVLVWLLRFLKDFENINIFITTQNTQSLSFVRGYVPNNLVACEVWGFIRSVQTEFIHKRITMVDLQPSLLESKHELCKLIANCKDNIQSKQTEYVIYRNRTFGMTFLKTELTQITPTSRPSSVGSTRAIHEIKSSNRTNLSGLFMTPIERVVPQKERERGSVQLKVESMYVHPPEFMSSTTSCEFGTPKEWQNTENGNCVLGLEYTGHLCQANGNKFYRCGSGPESHETITDHEAWGTVALQPTHMRTVVTVSRECTVSLRELPFYHLGLLSTSVLLWSMVQLVPSRASVRIFTDLKELHYTPLLECMLRKLKSAKIREEDTGEVDVILIIGQPDCERLAALQNAKQVICLKWGISDSLHNHLTTHFNVNVSEVDTRKVFSESMIKSNLRKVVRWLKNNMSVKLSAAIKSSHNTDIQVSKSGAFNLPIEKTLNQLFSKDDIFITTGGLTGLGWQLTLLLAEIGVGRIATISRRSANKEIQAQIDEVQRQYDCSIICFQGDVCDLYAVQNMVNNLNSTYGQGKIRGVLHGAGVLDSKMLLHLESSHLDAVMKPKIIGAMNLHIATLTEQLDFFIMHSSITSFVGSPGQGNYGAANNFLDAFARWRRLHGLPAQAINWGALGVGMAARKEFVDNFVKRGHLLLSPTEIRSCFIQAILQNSTEIVYANIDWKQFSSDFFTPQMARVNISMGRLFSQKDIKPDTNMQQGAGKRFDVDQLKSADSDVQIESVQNLVLTTAKRVIGGDVGQLSLSSSFGQLGMDSMSAVTFSNVISQETNVRVKQELFLDLDKTIADVVDILNSSLFGASRKANKTGKTQQVKAAETSHL